MYFKQLHSSLSKSLCLLFFFFSGTISSNIYAQSCPAQGTEIFPNLHGEALIDALVAEYKTLTVKGYDTAREILYSDIDNRDGYVYGVYTGYQAPIDPEGGNPRSQANSVSINAEHTWPQSKGASGNAKSDMHHLYPTYASANSSRGNHPFAEIPDEETETWWRHDNRVSTPEANFIDEYSERKEGHISGVQEYDSWEPREDFKGDVARSMFYFYTMYKDQADAEDPLFFEVQKEFLRAWNQMDIVSQREYERTCAIAPYQDGKVNPFVIDPTLAERAYFDGQSSQTSVQFAASVLTINEAQNELEIEISITNPNADTSTTIDVFYIGGTAEAGVDFESFSQKSITFSEGSLDRESVRLTIYDDEEQEQIETIMLALKNIYGPENALIGQIDTLEVSIRDNDGLAPTNIWVNEIHYDNDGADEGEYIEIAVEAEAADLSTVNLTLYNGNGGSSYSTVNGSDFVPGETQNGITIYHVDFPSNGIQNGSPDGLSLDLDGELIQFISYEGSFVAIDGPAANRQSEDIGVEQTGDAAIGSSLALTGEGRTYSDFVWVVSESATKGGVNINQMFDLPTSMDDESVIANAINLHQNYPNPFNPTTNISYELKQPGQISLRVYNILGREVATLVTGYKSAGNHTVTFDAEGLSSGIYIYQLKTAEQTLTQKMLLTK